MEELVKFDKYRGQTIKLTKLQDIKFDGNHPNGINEGYTREGMLNIGLSNEHQCFLIIEGDRFFNTSQVLKIEEREGHDLAHTVNSLYKVEPVITAISGIQEKHSVKLEDSK